MLTEATAAILQAMAQRPAPPLEELTARGYRDMLAQMPRLPDPAVSDVEARWIDGAPVPVRMFRPADVEGPAPALIFYHGGGYVACSVESHENSCRRLAKFAGVAVLSVEYRLAPEHMFPAAVEDACEAARWIGAHVADLGLDPDRIGVGGDSAGGALAIVTAIRFRDEGGTVALRHQLLLYPSTDLGAETGSKSDFAVGFGLDVALSDWFLAQYVPAGHDHTDWRLSPARADPAGLPPATIITAGCDPLRDEAEDFGGKLRDAGVQADVRRFDGVIHGFMSMYQMEPKGAEAIAYGAERLRAAFDRA